MAARFSDPDNEIRLTLSSEAELAGIFESRDDMIDFIRDQDISQTRLTLEAQVADDEEWKKNNYLEGLREAWNDGLRERFKVDRDDPEASRVFEELKRYIDHVEQLLEREKRRFRREADRETDRELRNEVIDRLIERQADTLWYGEFRKRQLFYSLREPTDHKQRYFADPEELDRMEDVVVDQLLAALDSVNVSAQEGKD
jgi:uncharacterized protein YdiU (UPF0061 family)